MSNTKPVFGLAIDWETSGAAWGEDSSKYYQGLSFGAIIFETNTFTAVEKLYREIKFIPDQYKWSKEAENIHGMSQEYLAENGVDRNIAAIDLMEMIMTYIGPKSPVLLLGHNVEFDRRFTNQLLNSIEFEFSVERQQPNFTHVALHHVVIDTSALGLVAFGQYKSNALFQEIGFDDRGKHNALQDAEQTLAVCEAVQALVGMGRGLL